MSSKSIREVGNSRVDECSISTAGINLSVCLGGGGIPKFKTVTPPSIATASPSSTYFAIPPGLSPADLLDSPVLLSSSSVLASPTTGALVAQSLNQNPNTYNNNNNRSSSKNEEVSKYSDFTFQTQPPPSHAPSSSVFHHSFPSLSDQIWRGGQRQEQEQEQEQESWWNLREQGNQNEGAGASSIKAAMVKTEFPVSQSQSQSQAGGGRVVKDENPSYSYEALSSHSQQIQNGNGGCESEREKRRCSEDDGFNWRKYGQKQVKGSENPRSYYKCTFPNCPMKKKIERSLDGQITEIVYKGTHNHPKPVHPRRSSSSAASLPFQDHPHPCLLPQAQTDSSVGTPDNSSISVVDDDLDMPSHTHRSISTVTDFDNDDDANDEQPHAAKRWKADQGESECMSAAPRTGAVREPRVVVQTTSDIDILDDGYRWRKYGQKVVKGNPNPRSYYKCTHPGCPVRKHVERAAHDLRAVITTYEGKHNHEVPAARGSGLNRALPNSGNSNYYGNSANNNNNNNNNPLLLAPSTTPQPQASSSFEMQMLHNPAHSFDFSSFINHPPYYQDNMFIAPPKTKDEPKEDLFLDSLLY